MAQPSAEEVAAFMGLSPDHPEVLEAIEAQRRQSRVERSLGGRNPPGRCEAPIMGGRARRAANRSSRGVPPPATPAPKRKGDTAENPSSAKQDPDRSSVAEDRKAPRRDSDGHAQSQ